MVQATLSKNTTSHKRNTTPHLLSFHTNPEIYKSMDSTDATLGQYTSSIQHSIHQHPPNQETVASSLLERRLQSSSLDSAAPCSSDRIVCHKKGGLEKERILSNHSSHKHEVVFKSSQSINYNTELSERLSDQISTSVSTDTTSCPQNSLTRSHEWKQEVSSCCVMTSAGIHVTLTDYDAEPNSHTAALNTNDIIDYDLDIQSHATIDELIDSCSESHPAPTIRITDFDLESQGDPTIDRLIASVTARASPTDLLTPPRGRSLDSDSDAEDRRLLRGFSASPDRLSPSSGGESPSNYNYNSNFNSNRRNETTRSHRSAGTADRGPVIASLSSVIKRALSDKRHAHRPRSPWGEVDEADSASRLYQSDSYLPALRLQLDTQSPPLSPYNPDQARFTLPRSAGKNSVSFPNPPQTIVREQSYCEDSANSSISFLEGSSVYQSTEFQESVEQKSSPPISPLTKGLHCSSLSLYLPPPSIRSLNKMWHRCYSGDSLSGDEHRSEPGRLAVENTAHYDLAAKVILLGDYSVGKTCFLSTLAKAKDENGSGFCREYRAGELAEVVFKRQQKRAMIRVMDTGGQERYRSMTSSYYRGVHGCLLVFDVTREDTFNNIMIWHSDLQKYSTDQYVAAILVGTTSHPGERIISPERGLKLAESLGIPYMECAPDDASMTLSIIQRLTEKVIKFALRRSSFAIDIKPKSIVLLEEKKKKKFVCLC